MPDASNVLLVKTEMAALVDLAWHSLFAVALVAFAQTADTALAVARCSAFQLRIAGIAEPFACFAAHCQPCRQAAEAVVG